jgi:hypothetical protein
MEAWRGYGEWRGLLGDGLQVAAHWRAFYEGTDVAPFHETEGWVRRVRESFARREVAASADAEDAAPEMLALLRRAHRFIGGSVAEETLSAEIADLLARFPEEANHG